ncbi:O-antigen ligase family protein [Rhizobacter sp. SG703]|uniref:PglL family O-oligosaccharyltransferase n=1 Tax=Rhizobacter sp. SG703 TaxID=2587140 RepID=UPI001445EE61|nr:O-antigen ligase family protein [Rhizobacter sp. SG703]NKI94428.1 O-antigen ligase [Rhizobacter sp. SG703]
MIELLAMVCLGMAWLVPNHYLPWLSFYNEACAMLALWLLAFSLVRRWWRATLPAPFWAVSAVALVPLAQWAVGLVLYSGDAWVAMLYVLSFAMAIGVGRVWAAVNARESARTLATTILAAALVSAALAFSQALLLDVPALWVLDPIPGMRAYANLAQPNNLATLLGLGVVSVLLLRDQRQLSAVSAVAAALLLLGAMAVTQSRTTLLFGLAIMVVLWCMPAAARPRIPTSAVIAASVCEAVLLWAWPVAQKALFLTGVEALGTRAAATPRLQIWPMLLDAVGQSPWAGYGWLQVGAAHFKVANRHPAVEELWLHGHNLFIELFVWCGIPLGTLLSVAVLWWIRTRWRRVATPESGAGLLAIAVLFVHAMLELPHHYAYFLVPAGLWMGQIEQGLSSRSEWPARWAWPPALAAAVLTVGIAWNYREVEEDFRLFRFESARVGSLRATQLTPDAPFLSSIGAYVSFTRQEPRAGMSQEQLADMSRLITRYPYAPALARYAEALALNGRQDDAREVFNSILHIHGRAWYLQVKRALHEKGIERSPALLEFETTLPP